MKYLYATLMIGVSTLLLPIISYPSSKNTAHKKKISLKKRICRALCCCCSSDHSKPAKKIPQKPRRHPHTQKRQSTPSTYTNHNTKTNFSTIEDINITSQNDQRRIQEENDRRRAQEELEMVNKIIFDQIMVMNQINQPTCYDSNNQSCHDHQSCHH